MKSHPQCEANTDPITWQDSYDNHYNGCLMFPESMSKLADAVRDNHLQACGALTDTPRVSTDGSKISVLVATYGGNVNATTAAGNATGHIKAACDGKSSCDYVVNWHDIGDPFYGVAKDYPVTYTCGDGAIPKSLYVGPEAGFGKIVSLRCP